MDTESQLEKVQLPEGKYRGHWIYGLFPPGMLPDFSTQREGSICFESTDEDFCVGTARRISFSDSDDDNPFVTTFDVLASAVHDDGEVILDLLGSQSEVFPGSSVEVSRLWGSEPILLDGKRLSCTWAVVLDLKEEDFRTPTHLTFIGERVEDDA